jgi:hypothetical protein
MDSLKEFARCLCSRLTPEQLQEVLQAVTDSIIDGYCPICEAEDYPVDKDGNKIEEDDVSAAFEWREEHYDTCLVTLIEKHLSKEAVKTS